MMMSTPEFWVLIAFLLLGGVTGKWIYTQITYLTDSYRQQISRQVEEATQLCEEAFSLRESYQAKHDAAMEEVAKIAVAAEREVAVLQQASEEAYATFVAQKDRMLEERLSLDRQEILSKLQAQTLEAALKIVEKRLGEDEKLRHKLTHDALEAMDLST